MNSKGTEGWAAGEYGPFFQYKENQWKPFNNTGEAAIMAINSLRLNDDGIEGWSVGNSGRIFHYNESQWKLFQQAAKLPREDLESVWLNSSGTEGWAVGDKGEIIQLDGNQWKWHSFSKRLNRDSHYYSIWLNEEGTEGWAVGTSLVAGRWVSGIIYYDGDQWYEDLQVNNPRSNSLYSIQMNKDGTRGWGVGSSGTIVRYFSRNIDNATLEYDNEDELHHLKGKFILHSKHKLKGSVKEKKAVTVELINEEVNAAVSLETTLLKMTDTRYQFSFINSDKVLSGLRNRRCHLLIKMNYDHPSLPVEATYKTRSFYITGAPGWHKYIKISLLFMILNIVLALLATSSGWIRRLILHPVGSTVVGLIIWKYLVIDLLIHFVKPIRLGLFRDYRKEVKKAVYIETWESKIYIPPSIKLPGKPPAASTRDEVQYKKTLKQILQTHKKQLWLIVGQSGLGKTALLENWARYALELKKIPILIPLGSNLLPAEEAAAAMSQYGDIDVKADVAFDLLKAGDFLIMLDGFNEDMTPDITREFVRQVSKRNHVIMTSQYTPNWISIVKISSVTLEPFGAEQLTKLMPEEFSQKLLESDYLKDLAGLPQTAELLASYVKRHNTIPPLRLDVFRNLRTNLETKYSGELLNLEYMAWELFQKNEKPFEFTNALPEEFCDSAVIEGILTKTGRKYRFRHEIIHRFFVAMYLWSNDRQPIEKLHQQLGKGIGKESWNNTLEFLGEFYAEKAVENETFAGTYYQFLEETANFSIIIYAESLFPQLARLYTLDWLKKDLKFIFWSVQKMAPIAANAKGFVKEPENCRAAEGRE